MAISEAALNRLREAVGRCIGAITAMEIHLESLCQRVEVMEDLQENEESASGSATIIACRETLLGKMRRLRADWKAIQVQARTLGLVPKNSNGRGGHEKSN